jgi:cyclic pyranopterin phosphate synthase
MKNKRAEINLGFVCNNLCKFCMVGVLPEQRKFSSFVSLKKEIADYYKRGYRALGFLGGEPTIYPKIAGLASFARRLGFKRILIVSNGRRYSDKAFLEKLIHSGVTSFYVSIHSHKAGIEDYLTSVKGSFREKIEGLRNLQYFRDRGLIKDTIFLNIVVNKRNYKYLRDIILFYYRMGFSAFRFNFIRPEGRGFLYARQMVPAYSRIMKHVREALDSAKALNAEISFDSIPPCLFYRYRIEGFEHYIGELRDGPTESSLEEGGRRRRFVISQVRISRDKTKGRSCKKCVFDPICEGVWKNYKRLYGMKEFKPVIKP